jgi:uncharacterized protein YxeA
VKKTLSVLTLSAALLIGTGTAVAQEHRDGRDYYDKHHKDHHQWNDHEDRAWRMYNEQHHLKYVDWNRARNRDQQAYWNWRHSHSDSLLRIDIR